MKYIVNLNVDLGPDYDQQDTDTGSTIRLPGLNAIREAIALGNFEVTGMTAETGEDEDEATVEVHRTCVSCHEEHILRVPLAGFVEWREGSLIQNALPDLSAAERELLVSSTCGPCFDRMWGGDEDVSEEMRT